MSEVKEEIEIVVTEEQQELVDATIAADKLEDEAAARIKAKYASDSTKNVKKIFHIEVRDEDDDEDGNPVWVGAYFGKPTLSLFSQFSKNAQKDRINALKVLLVNLFLEGDRRLLDDDDYFLAAMGQIEDIVNVQQARIKKF
jgi:hypothetical protein